MLVVLIALPVLALAVAVAFVVARRTAPPAPTQAGTHAVPSQLDRGDFHRPEAPWLVVVFTSETCDSCAATWNKAELLASDEVAVQQVTFQADRRLHDRYGVEAVPTLVVADPDGAVQASFIGTPSAADLWAAVAELREPGSTPPGCDHHGSAPA